MRYAALITLLILLSGCASNPEKYVITETYQNAEDDFDAPVDSHLPIVACQPESVDSPSTVPAVTTPKKDVVTTRPTVKLNISKPRLKAVVHMTDPCDACHKLQKKWGAGNDRIEITYTYEKPKKGPADTFPTIRWIDSEGLTRWPVDAKTQRAAIPDTLDQLADIIERNNKPKVQRKSNQSPVKFGYESWTENATGHTSLRHLIQAHGLSYDQVAPYANDQGALNLIHGWKHTGQGYVPANQFILNSPSQETLEPWSESAAVVGSVEGAGSLVNDGLLFWQEKIGEGNTATIEWDRTGAQTKSLLSISKIQLVELIGELGAVRLLAPGSKLPVQDLEVGYRSLGGGVWRLTGSADVTFNEGDTLPLTSGGKVSFADPMTILTLVSAGRTIWELLHPKADITLPSRMAAEVVLTGSMLTVNFKRGPMIHASWLVLNFDLGVQKVEITSQSVRVVFTGSRWIKERTFKVTSQRSNKTVLAA